MKNRGSESREQRAVTGKPRRLLGAAAVFCLGFALALTGCDTGSTGGGGGGGGGATPPAAPTPGPNDGPLFRGTMMQLTGSVHQGSWDANDNFVTTPFTGGVPNLSGGNWGFFGSRDQWIAAGGSGAVVNGQLSFSAGVPSMTMTMGGFFDDDFSFAFNNFTISNPNTGVAVIDTLRAEDGRQLQMFRQTATMWEDVKFIYVASDVTVSGTGRSWTENWDCTCSINPETGECWCFGSQGDCDCVGSIHLTSTTFSLNFQQGWNAIRFVMQENAAGTAARITILPGTPAPAVAMWVLSSGSSSPELSAFSESAGGSRLFRGSRE